MTALRAGMKVVCVDADAGPLGWGKGGRPVEGAVYTITSVHLSRGIPTVWLAEIARTPLCQAMHGRTVGYYARRFRPVKITDISTFKAMLVPTPSKTKETV